MPSDANDFEKGKPVPVKGAKDEEPVRVTDRRFWVRDADTPNDAPQASYSFKPSYVEELEKKVAESQRKAEEVLASYREFKANVAEETQRARERIQNEYNRRLSQAKIDVVARFIDVLENFERALTAARGKPSFDTLLEGVELIRNQFLAKLGELGVSEVEVLGKLFDPQVAEAVGTVDVSREEQDQLIVEVVGKGYAVDQTLLRPAQVRVGRYLSSKAGNSVPESHG
ncbi:MAG: nucleotide exchange factor GrpE [Acidimicrobiia bacterium]|nr:nucleotide exchange factor GrpE [Acidimicrobiia bacterium]